MIREITFTLTADDITAALKAHAARRTMSQKTGRRLLLLWGGVSLVAACLALLSNYFGAIYIPPASVVAFCAIYAVVVFGIPLWQLHIALPRRIKAALSQNRTIDMEQVMVWDKKALAFKSQYIKGTYPWAMVHHTDEFPEFIALYLSNDKFNIVPKRALNDEQLDDLRSIIANEVKPGETAPVQSTQPKMPS